ncbi:MAG: hypothetical protein ACWA5P_02840 [bacterium]
MKKLRFIKDKLVELSGMICMTFAMSYLTTVTMLYFKDINTEDEKTYIQQVKRVNNQIISKL